MNPLGLTAAQISQPGGRAINEDACGWVDGCWIVADGLGGHGGGEVASKLAVEQVLAAAAQAPLIDPNALTSAIEAADAAIGAHQQDEPRLAQMRTTLVVLASDGLSARWAHVGDSRLYHLREGRIRLHTLDHSVPQALVSAGQLSDDEIRHHEDRNRLLRSLGNDKPTRLTLSEPLSLQPGDAFLLCSDGFWEYVADAEMEVTLAKAAQPAQWLALMERMLLDRAPSDHDNYSGLAVFVDSDA